MSYGLLQYVLQRCLQDVFKTSSRLLQDIFKMYKRYTTADNLVFLTRLKEVLKTSSNCIAENTSVSKRILNKFSRITLRIQSECGKIRTRKNSVFEHFAYSGTAKKNIYRMIHLGQIFWRIDVLGTNFLSVNSFNIWKL